MWEEITASTWVIIVLLLVAFILGYILRLLLGSKANDSRVEMDEWKSKFEGSCNKLVRFEANLSTAKKKNNRLQIELDELRKASLASNTLRDDLTKVEGIGLKEQDLLYAEGIWSWQQLSTTEVAIIRDILTAAGDIYRQHNPDTWPLQAGMASDGKWVELKKWQSERDHGLN